MENSSEFNINIITWYNFRIGSKILFVGENDSIIERLKKDHNVFVKNTEKEYDYIIIYSYCDDVINTYLNFLSDNGKLIIIGNNSLGIDNWSKFSKNDNEGIKYLEKCNNFSNIYNVENELIKNKLLFNVFYAFPNYKETEIVVKYDKNIDSTKIERFKEKLNEDEFLIFDEVKVLKNIVKYDYNLLKVFGNSYFIETSKSEIENNIQYAFFNKVRKEKYRIITLLKDDVVEKIPETDEANYQIQNIKDNINKLENTDYKILDYIYDNKVYSKLIKNQDTLDILIDKNYDNKEYLINIFNKLKNELMKYKIDYKDCKKNIKFNNLDKSLILNLHFLKDAYWDMIPKNCFYINDEFYFFDQEWREEYLPVEFIIYRSIINCYGLVKNIDINILLKDLGLLEYKDYFDEINESIFNEIYDKKIYEETHKRKIESVEKIITENIDYKIDNDNKEKYINSLNEILKGYEQENLKKEKYIKDLESQIESLKRNKFSLRKGK